MSERFLHPNALWLLLTLIPLIVWWVKRGRNGDPAITVSTTSNYNIGGGLSQWRRWLRHVVFAARLAALACLIVIIARPQGHGTTSTRRNTVGTDIVIALDISSTMLARDITPNRMEAAQKVATDFVNNRENDNIGLVIFASEAFTQVPLTTDRATLVNMIEQIQMGLIDDGTAIGDGIATAINRLLESKAKSKSIILLTDGSNNTGMTTPLTAAQIAREKGIRIYTVGIGTNGYAEMPVARGFDGELIYQRVKVDFDEPTLRQIAKTTGGQYFRATSKNMLEQVFREIDRLEKSHIDQQTFTTTEDRYQPWAIALLTLVLFTVIADYLVLRRIP